MTRYERMKRYFDAYVESASPAKAERMAFEMKTGADHFVVDPFQKPGPLNDMEIFGFERSLDFSPVSAITIDDLLRRDKQRETDGFWKKIRIGRLVKVSAGGQKIKVVPSTVEEKLLHDRDFKPQEDSAGGVGDEEEGEVIGEEEAKEEGEGGNAGPGQGDGGEHELGNELYEIGKMIGERLELPNLKKKGKRRAVDRYTYDLTDMHRGSGQVLDKRATLKRVVKTNLLLGNIPDVSNINPADFVIGPQDKMYRTLSREKDYEYQALVFFIRDYSGSMDGLRTQVVVAQHVHIYAWLLYQYKGRVETRFVLHDTEAKEVPNFYEYQRRKVAGGTMVSSAYKYVNEQIRKSSLYRDYNIYVFQGTDGDDWDHEGKQAIPLLEELLNYVNRMGITVVKPSDIDTELEKYIKASGLLESKKQLLRMHALAERANDDQIIEGIKKLVSEG
jgi:hypothetical protein